MSIVHLGFAALAVVGCAVPACAPSDAPGVPVEVSVPAACVAVLTEDEVPVVEVSYGVELGCDLVPPMQLNVIYDEAHHPWGSDESTSAHDEGWGGDASVEAAHADCLDVGGSPIWLNAGAYRLVCVGVDY